ncbi:3-hydroxyacyl-CoA dehydrogenase / enoyl-CoA hydratase / 3-hydroxybutyryl-CoA epimerase [Nitrosomonas sp. Nm51]|uniref:3-hydroxyacyl-CoA dehydrogenase NAD-binding domain-containing protein n=1 Tax=Nitrosomonas sp. Nm51 TaxID=133720 RepID=UPI0008BF7113|nr:3-hydroxyacyl-CoA dehydrogenase NAD-binding domain-containing protein [Nitrosomonas sp. Nm51]SER40081.1 3-hydroxyacyl-CoA dehydrogenase / enoyl-CoA hydratase / 3-hydroxybutyryl-CoA epimerase [Nitrosomonas sp. Nm51]
MKVDVLPHVENMRHSTPSYTSEKANWRTRIDEDGIFWLQLDKKDSSANTLSEDVLQELDEILADIEKKPPKALVIDSAKPKGFCAGADIKSFKNHDESGMADMLHRGHAVLDKLVALDMPTIAVIHGHCLGGGLELALACRQRIGIKDGLEMGFPEIRLGVHPGLGGTYRLTRLINPITAMTMMLTGKSAHDKQARKRGLIDDLVERRHIENAVRAAIGKGIKKRRRGFGNYILNTLIVRKFAAKKMRAESEKKAPSANYPAPYALIDLWEKYGANTHKMQAAEVQSFARLMVSETANNLVRVFFLHQSLKRQAKNHAGIQHVHVIGAGSMGGEIAGWCAMQGLKVTLSDQKAEPIAQAVKNTEQLCNSKHKSNAETRDALDRLISDMRNTGLENADLIIEAVPEKIEIKKKLYQAIESGIKPDAILATNTSSILIEKLADCLNNPARFMGLHFFNPVSKMLMVEAIGHENTGAEVVERMLAFTRDIGKIPVRVTSYPGFLVNRALTPYLLEAIIMLEEGIDKTHIDDTAKKFGMPMGPIELIDQIGLDICIHVADMLADSLDKPVAKIPGSVRKKAENGKLGKKTGEGFYQWKDGKAQRGENSSEKQSAKNNDDQVTDRLILPMLDACVECYRREVVRDLDHLDGAMIFATGFAPFRGGPIHYARTRGVNEIITALEKLCEQHDERFKPDQGWQSL